MEASNVVSSVSQTGSAVPSPLAGTSPSCTGRYAGSSIRRPRSAMTDPSRLGRGRRSAHPATANRSRSPVPSSSTSQIVVSRMRSGWTSAGFFAAYTTLCPSGMNSASR
jgi:hypothetical protein